MEDLKNFSNEELIEELTERGFLVGKAVLFFDESEKEEDGSKVLERLEALESHVKQVEASTDSKLKAMNSSICMLEDMAKRPKVSTGLVEGKKGSFDLDSGELEFK